MAEHRTSRPRHTRAFNSAGHDLGSPSPSMSNSSSGESDDGELAPRGRSVDRMRRPVLPERMASGTLIVPREAANVEVEEVYGPGDARTMSPRRTNEEVDRLGESAREALLQQARELQDSLLQIVERVETVKAEQEKLEGGNRFLQSYIGELMSTSKLTSTGGKSKAKGKASK